MITLLFPLLALTASMPAPKLPDLKMTSPDSATAQYANKCDNGADLDGENRDKFVKLMLANRDSKLSQAKAELLKSLDDHRGDGVYTGDFTQTFSERSGCGSSHSSYSAPLVTVTGGNAFHTVTKALVTIDDDVDEGFRKLSLRSIQPLEIRDDP